MTKKSQSIFSTETQLVYETVVNGNQGVLLLEKGKPQFLNSTLKQVMATNEKYFATNLQISKKFAKDIIGTSHGAPYFFMDLVFVPIESYNRSVILYISLNHVKRFVDEESNENETVLELTYGVKVRLAMKESPVIKRIANASFLKDQYVLRKQPMIRRKNEEEKNFEIIKEHGNVYYTNKKTES